MATAATDSYRGSVQDKFGACRRGGQGSVQGNAGTYPTG